MKAVLKSSLQGGESGTSTVPGLRTRTRASSTRGQSHKHVILLQPLYSFYINIIIHPLHWDLHSSMTITVPEAFQFCWSNSAFLRELVFLASLTAAWFWGWQCLSVCQAVHNFGLDWNTSTSIKLDCCKFSEVFVARWWILFTVVIPWLFL